jgi:hypothetical protein
MDPDPAAIDEYIRDLLGTSNPLARRMRREP